MPILPPRRWLQFQLSTWFVLVTILAWALSIWPWFVTSHTSHVVYKTNGDPDYLSIDEDLLLPSPAYIYPALALAAFVGWKAALAIGRRVAERKLRGMTASSS